MFLASLGLGGCPGGGGGGGSCPEIGGTWSIGGDCSGPTSCEVEQDGCSITLNCNDGRMLEGKVTKSSATFKDDEVSCSGSLVGLEDDGSGVIHPNINGECRPEGSDACDIVASCEVGDCTVPEDEDDDNGGDGDGDGDSGQGGGSGFLGGDGDGDGDSGQGGFTGGGEGGVSGEGGFGGEAGVPPGGQGGISGEGGAPAGSGGFGGSSGGECGSCLQSSCSTELSACTSANGCEPVMTCLLDSGCYFDDDTCVEAACSGLTEPGDEGLNALVEVFNCTDLNCLDTCTSGNVEPNPEPQACDTCIYWGDGVCDDGSFGGDVYCDVGTDCTDCGGSSQ